MQSLNNILGLHLRLDKTLHHLIEEVKRHNVKTFQFFLAPSPDAKYITISEQERKTFLRFKEINLSHVFIHSSYWINPASGRTISFETSKKLLQQEINLAKKLDIPYIVLHPGSATWFKKRANDPDCKQLGLERIASMLNGLLKYERELTILLENTAHGNRCIGSNLHDFVQLQNLLHHPEKIKFCLDLAHAFVYGYNLADITSFLTMVDTTMGLSNIKLIHFNDAAEKHGSKQDKHEIPGQGHIGTDLLKQYLTHPMLQAIPKIMELPNLPFETTHTIYKTVHMWQL